MTRRLLLEFVVIVLGVLVALAADRWAQDRADRVLELQYVERLTSDIRSDSVRVEEYLAGFQEIEAARDSLLSFVEGGPVPPALTSLVSRAFRQLGLPVPTTWNEILGASSLGLISDVRTRDILTEYYGAERPRIELNLDRSDRRGRDPFTDALYPMGLFQPCLPGQECAVEVLDAEGNSNRMATFRKLDPELFRQWPGIRELLVGLGSHSGTQRVFAEELLRLSKNTLVSLSAAR